MSFLDRLFKRSEPVQQKSANPPLFSSLSLSAMPKMTERQYLEAYKGWVFTCTNAIARRMAAVELKLQQHNTNGDWIDIPNHEALDLIHRVNDFMSFYDLWFATQAYIELDGNAFWKLNYNSRNEIEEIWILDPTQME